jgi:hypothetical protein
MPRHYRLERIYEAFDHRGAGICQCLGDNCVHVLRPFHTKALCATCLGNLDEVDALQLDPILVNPNILPIFHTFGEALLTDA